MSFEEYINNISNDCEWGTEITLLAASLCLEIEINVYDKYSNIKISTYNSSASSNNQIYIYYDNEMKHYNAINLDNEDIDNIDYDTDEDVNNIDYEYDNIDDDIDYEYTFNLDNIDDNIDDYNNIDNEDK
jgi:hypothetical protein